MEDMRNYIFVSNESFEKLTSFYFNHLKTKKEKYEVFAKPINLLNMESKRVVFLLENNHSKNLEEIYKQISELNQVDVKSTIITEQIEETVLQRFSQLNAMVLMSEVPQDDSINDKFIEDNSSIATSSAGIKINFFNKLKNGLNYFISSTGVSISDKFKIFINHFNSMLCILLVREKNQHKI